MIDFLADLPISPADPMAGWISLIIQTGALGILGYVVLKLAPQLIREAREDREKMEDRHYRAMEVLQSKFEARTALTVGAIDRQTERLEKAMQMVCKATQENRRGPS